MWLTKDGVIHTVAIDIEFIDGDSTMRAVAAGATTDQLSRIARCLEEVGRQAFERCSQLEFDQDREAQFVEMPLPLGLMDYLRSAGWLNCAALRIQVESTPARWQIDILDVMQDLVDSVD